MFYWPIFGFHRVGSEKGVDIKWDNIFHHLLKYKKATPRNWALDSDMNPADAQRHRRETACLFYVSELSTWPASDI